MLSIFVWVLAAAVSVATLLPFTHSAIWWVRMWDFPRLHIMATAMIALLLSLLFAVSFKVPLLVILLLVFAYQAIQVFPYTSIARTEVEFSKLPVGQTAVSMMAVNVLMENTHHDDLTAIIEREDPDVLFLMETDEVWGKALQGVLSRYTTVTSHLTDDHYGLIFATRLEAVNVDLLWPEDDNTPTLKAVLKDANGLDFNFIGLHPRPPVPGNDTKARDKQIKKAARMTSSSDRPTVCMGDFNDVAWSWTTRRFKRYGNFVEPRVGRGMMSSFHAKYWFMRLPIDQLFLTKDVHLVSFKRLEFFGSDHFPISANVFFGDARGQADG